MSKLVVIIQCDTVQQRCCGYTPFIAVRASLPVIPRIRIT